MSIIKNSQVKISISIIILIVIFSGFTYAFFRPQGGNFTINDVSVTSNTTDNLSFQVGNDISFRITQADFAQGGNNKSGSSNVTALLTPNNKTGEATMHYYMYLNLKNNGIVYSSTNLNHDPELLIQVFDSNNNLITLPSLGSRKTINGVTGYDITGKEGLITLLDDHAITTSGSATNTETWQVVVTVINLDVDQQDNTNKEVVGEIIVQKDPRSDDPRFAIVVPQKQNDVSVGYVESLIESEFNSNLDEIYTIYTVGYIENSSTTDVEYSIDIKNLKIDFKEYELELFGSPQVMTNLEDFQNYKEMKSRSLQVMGLSDDDSTSAVATAQELYTYSLDSSVLTIDSVNMSCNNEKCTATISESLGDISGKSKHNTTTNGGNPISVVYNGIKFNLKVKKKNPIVLDNGYIYYHDNNLTNGANDNSYRYAGENPNNYICFGSDFTPCPESNIYRIIGKIPVDVVVDDTTNPVTTERQVLYKLIKNDYETLSSIYMTKNGTSSMESNYNGPSDNQPTSSVDGFYWTDPDNLSGGNYSNGNSSNTYNTWSGSELNTVGLNTNAFGMLETKWQEKIAKVVWKVGGNSSINYSSPMTVVYSNEIINPVTNKTQDDKTEYVAKIGLMYASDYGYAAPQSVWTNSLNSYNDASIKAYNWLYKGVNEWTITRDSSGYYNANYIEKRGFGSSGFVYSSALGVRRTFYLNEETTIDMDNYSGTKTDPYRIGYSDDLSKYTVSFDSNGGSDISDQYISNGNIVYIPTEPIRENYVFVEWQLNNETYDFSTPVTSNITLTAVWKYIGQGFLYHHTFDFEDSAADGSYRYAGANPNNWICFGSNSEICPAENLYRIIGLIPVDVVIDENTTERQNLYKLIRNDYESASTLGMSRNGTARKAGDNYGGPSGNLPDITVDGFYWKGTLYDNYNTWSLSTLNTVGLNTNVLNSLGDYANQIANVVWKVGGNDGLSSTVAMRRVFNNEITNSVTDKTQDDTTDYIAKIGMMYVSDYGYAAPQFAWSYPLSGWDTHYGTNLIRSQNWLYRGTDELTITRCSNGYIFVNTIYFGGSMSAVNVYSGYGVRRVFYLKNNVVIDMINHLGTKTDPFRVS